MFVRIKKTPNSSKTAVQLVENVRHRSRVKQIILRHFGYGSTEEDIKALKNLAYQYKGELESNRQPCLFEKGAVMEKVQRSSDRSEKDESLPVDLKKIIEEKRIKTGIHQIYGKVFSGIGFDKVIKHPSRKQASVRLMRDIIMARINRPESKRSLVNSLSGEYGIEAHLNSVYRMMDYLDDTAIEKIKELASNHGYGLCGGKTDVIFYDCTTLYFESFTQDELKENGYSKDCKFNQPQVLVAIMVTPHGLPVGYEVFPGSTFEGHTLERAMDKLKETCQIGKVVFVADAALLSGDNLKLIESLQQPYIVGARIKNMNKEVSGKILDTAKYKPLYEEKQQQQQEGGDIIYREIGLEASRRLILTHSPKRAAKDRYDREKSIEKIKQKLAKSKNPKSLLSNYGYKKFIDVEGVASIVLKEEKIKEAEKWDGLHGIITNLSGEQSHAKEVLSQYKGLWQVEETFRISKHDMKTRPIFHWTPRRVRAHIALCYMALTCIRSLEHKVRLQYKKMSPEAIRKCISDLEVSILKDIGTGKRYGLPSQPSQDAKKIYQIFNLKLPNSPYLIT